LEKDKSLQQKQETLSHGHPDLLYKNIFTLTRTTRSIVKSDPLKDF